MKLLKIILLISTFSSLVYLSFIFIKKYNALENIEKRCTIKFQKDSKMGLDKSEEEWNLNMEIADNNYLKCMGIP
tara:strand:- start:71 stop:295 length:225 start_codon:yes stop_codon:yes gene_type:complete